MMWGYEQQQYRFMSASRDGDVFAIAYCVFTPILSVAQGLYFTWCMMKQIRELVWEELSDPVHQGAGQEQRCVGDTASAVVDLCWIKFAGLLHH